MKSAKEYINLLPPIEKKPFGAWGAWSLGLAVFLVTWAVLFGLKLKQRVELQARLDSLSTQRIAMEREVAAVRAEIRATAAPGASPEKAELIQSLLSERVLWSQVFLQFSRVVPRGLWFDSMEGATDGKAQIRIRGGAFTYRSVSEFMLAMEQSEYFEQPQLISAQKVVLQGREIVSFELVCGVKKYQGVR